MALNSEKSRCFTCWKIQVQGKKHKFYLKPCLTPHVVVFIVNKCSCSYSVFHSIEMLWMSSWLHPPTKQQHKSAKVNKTQTESEIAETLPPTNLTPLWMIQLSMHIIIIQIINRIPKQPETSWGEPNLRRWPLDDICSEWYFTFTFSWRPWPSNHSLSGNVGFACKTRSKRDGGTPKTR